MTYKRKTQSRLNSSFFFFLLEKKITCRGVRPGDAKVGGEGRGSEVCRFRNFFFLVCGVTF